MVVVVVLVLEIIITRRENTKGLKDERMKAVSMMWKEKCISIWNDGVQVYLLELKGNLNVCKEIVWKDFLNKMSFGKATSSIQVQHLSHSNDAHSCPNYHSSHSDDAQLSQLSNTQRSINAYLWGTSIYHPSKALGKRHLPIAEILWVSTLARIPGFIQMYHVFTAALCGVHHRPIERWHDSCWHYIPWVYKIEAEVDLIEWAVPELYMNLLPF